jgi:uncharacterized repeat protein (TIGR02543 family)
VSSRIVGRIWHVLAILTVTTLGLVIITNAASAVPPAEHTVTFYDNVPGSLSSPVPQTDNISAPLQAFSTMEFSYSNFFFSDWNTQPNGSGTPYSDQATFPFTADVQMYAQWIQVTHSVILYANLSNTDNSNKVETGNSPMSLTSVLTLGIANPNHTFTGWNTQRNGSGTVYDDQANYSFVSDLLLYAQWALIDEILSFSSNTGSGTVAPLAAAYGSSVTLPNGSSLSKTHYTFAGWNTRPDGSGTMYVPGASITVSNGETFYAMWSRDTYKVLFDVPGFKDKVAPISVPAGDSIRLRSSSGLSKAGYSFSGWFTEPKRGHFAGKSDASYTPLASITLYARWTANSLIKVEFLDNGGVGHIRARSVHSGLAVVIPNGADLHRKGFTFRGWASSPRAPGPTVHVGSKLVLTHNTELYALWRRALPASTPQVLLGSIGIFRPNSSVLTPAMRHYVALLAIGINQHNRTMVLIYGYATSLDSAKGSALLSLQRALAVEKQLNIDLSGLNDVGVIVHATGEGRLTDSALASFRKVEVFAN